MKVKKVTAQDTAIKLATSMRGQFIISRALYEAVVKLKVDHHSPVSGIADMEYLLEHLFTLYPVIKEGKKLYTKKT